MMKDKAFIPKLLGYLGLLPVIVPTVLLFLDKHHPAIWAHFIITYAAIILSFVGALHWAFAMTIHQASKLDKQFSFIWSVIPSLIAWLSLLINHLFASILLAIFFILNLAKDKNLAKKFDLPEWYLSLRTRLTYIVTICLVVAAIHFKTS